MVMRVAMVYGRVGSIYVTEYSTTYLNIILHIATLLLDILLRMVTHTIITVCCC